MFHSAANPIIRLVFAPTLLLFYLTVQGAFMPVLAPMFVVIFLTIMSSRPPLSMMLKLLVVLLLVGVGIIAVGEVLIDSPTGFGLFCWVALFWSFYRSHKDPKDIFATFLLLFVVITSVINLQFGVSISSLPLVLLETFVTALAVTYISFLLFPGDEKDILPDEQDMQGAELHFGLIAFKTTILFVSLMALIGTGSSQTLLIVITIGSMIKIPISRDQRIFRNNRLISTTVGILSTIPIMLVHTGGFPMWATLGITCFLGLQLACYAIRKQCRRSIYQLLFINFIVLVSQIISYLGSEALMAELTRLASILVAIIIATVILNLVPISPVVTKSS
ncbi:DUF2955 domain-containing protein [Vibrio mimicus]|uniref:DUF2955 domain-containing protein n=1 Tax=Vibrio mimicus TaxID=674 RepID=UPI00050C0571|nr:DUF2955 domain-containing protein [Vibrio mimicus]MBY7673497.1 DUF2955 domain-containing protein [Vibrio mimicus]MBY7725690.1 DUF2955 domain-containing protein [Vibrio mimicus]TXY31225.1 DUF2955 domain-containing protein [Vibrio mimicus]